MKFYSVVDLLWMLLLFSSTGYSSPGPNKKFDCKGRVEHCERKNVAIRRPVCGTDNISYPNRCALVKVRCFNDTLLRVKHRGQCKEKQPCWVDLTIKTDDPTRTPDSYMPRCKADGTYFRIQCHKKEGNCWCVTPAGKVVPNTNVIGKKPKCSNRGKWPKNGSSQNKNIRRRECRKNDKATFISNLVRIFRTEYNRDYNATFISSGDRTLLDPVVLDSRATEWKFGALDTDKSYNLTKLEYKDLRKLVRKVVRPKRCAIAFIRMCDTDRNGVLSKTEWTNCMLLNTGTMDQRTSTTSTTTTTSTTSTTTTTTTTTARPQLMDHDNGRSRHDKSDSDEVLREGFATLTGILPGLTAEGDQDTEAEVKDCLTDRQEALDDSLTSSYEYIPECTADGKYNRVQCYLSVGYCWCTQEDTGKPIPGTSVKNSTPKCDSVLDLVPQPIKGCPEQSKNIFLKDLMDYLKQKHSKNNTRDYESILSDIFHNTLDTNRNQILELKEWKSFRKEIATESKLRQCGKKILRHCDVNHDTRIGFVEWMNCLNVKQVQYQPQPTETTVPTTAKRRGPNPLESYLKGDD